ncbi:hypothetical protein G5I_02559 [Acromyrmex echinatior]|uniref:DUF4817 domain-containing protein n=1 Tax=Acromyrmex echinatior TaxID=103372 RepID=F4WAM1_ACREC|nr:hypothetical protein G5I_02559 [Acromyrmex echinatior]
MKKFTIKGVLDGFRSSVPQPTKPDQEIIENLRPEHFQVKKCCVAETVRILKRNMGRDRAPTEGAIRKLVRKVREKGMLVDDIILRLF